MGLRDYQLKTTTIEGPGGSITVGALTFADMMTVASTYAPQAAMLFAKLQSGGKIDAVDVKTTIYGLLPQFPDLVAALIAMASDEYDPEGVRMAGKLPVPLQAELVEAIFVNTISSDAELKKFMELVVRMLSGITTALTNAQLPLHSMAGFGASVGK